MLSHTRSRACGCSRQPGRVAGPCVPVRTSRAARRGAVVVQANLFARVVRLFKSTATNLVSSAEDPEKLLDQVVTEMQEDLIKMRQAAAQVMASQKQLEAKYKQAQNTADDWLRRAELAVQKGEDELAKEALKRRKSYQENADQLKVQMEMQAKAVDMVINNSRLLEGKLTEARGKKDTLKARATSAKTSKQIQEMIGSLNTSSSVVAFDKMEEKVMAMEAEAESTSLLVGNDKMEDRFAQLESGSVEDELALLKKGITLKGPAEPVAALPAGRPVKDAIDMEIEELRRKARE
mmetsp:Transcript_18074/g.30944  ORF Transcript_18074/g.30944 Transcript_18074/m.30944 type:complete len:293 (-) Transcript_18074:1025-1903(-)